MILNIEKLYDNSSNQWDYGYQVENYVANLLSDIFQIPYYEVSKGFCPEYDFIIGNLAFELKCTKNKSLFFETNYGDGRLSGLSLTIADYYVCISISSSQVSPGVFQDKGKLRIIPVHELKSHAVNPIKPYTFVKNDKGPGAIGFYLMPKEIEHKWLGDFDYDPNTGEIDLASFVPNKGLSSVARGIRKESEMMV